MKRFLALWTEEDGVLSFEWTLLLTLLTIGIVGGLAAARDAIIDELGDVAEAAQAFDQSYSLSGFDVPGIFSSNPSIYLESPEDQVFVDCGRTAAPTGQTPQEVTDLPS
jgi:Flp pilus assembly pilin Flp